MPQMMPMNWIIMFIQISITISSVMIMIYFIPNTMPKNKPNPIKSINTNWMW